MISGLIQSTISYTLLLTFVLWFKKKKCCKKKISVLYSCVCGTVHQVGKTGQQQSQDPFRDGGWSAKLTSLIKGEVIEMRRWKSIPSEDSRFLKGSACRSLLYCLYCRTKWAWNMVLESVFPGHPGIFHNLVIYRTKDKLRVRTLFHCFLLHPHPPLALPLLHLYCSSQHSWSLCSVS